jgi:hypothetical protein
MNVKGRFIGGTSERQDVNKSVMGGWIWMKFIVYMYENAIMKPLFFKIK